MRFRAAGSLRNTDLVMNNLFWIGMYPGVTKAMIDYVLDVFSQFIEGNG
ncbi:MAG: hypothetical protein ACXV76_11920 [Halobacteriota archaeon]